MTRKVPLITGGEARYHDDDHGKDMQLDEVCVSSPRHVHVERMDRDHVWMGITGPDGEMVHVSFYSKGPLRFFIAAEERPALPPPSVDPFSSPVIMACALARLARQGDIGQPLQRRTVGQPGVPSRTVGVSLMHRGAWVHLPISEVRP